MSCPIYAHSEWSLMGNHNNGKKESNGPMVSHVGVQKLARQHDV